MKQDIKKMQGASMAPMTRLKELWRELPEVDREKWRDLFVSNVRSVEIRAKMKTELKIELASDSQLCRFRDWAEKEHSAQEMRERVKEDEKFWERQFGKRIGFDKARRKLLACSYARALREGNYKQGLATIHADLRVETHGLEEW